jgi:hypothetical protein
VVLKEIIRHNYNLRKLLIINVCQKQELINLSQSSNPDKNRKLCYDKIDVEKTVDLLKFKGYHHQMTRHIQNF